MNSSENIEHGMGLIMFIRVNSILRWDKTALFEINFYISATETVDVAS